MSWLLFYLFHVTNLPSLPPSIFYFFLILGKMRAWAREGKRERGTEDLKWALCWQQRAWCGAWTQVLCDHDLSQRWMLNWLSHPGTPGPPIYYVIVLLVSVGSVNLRNISLLLVYASVLCFCSGSVSFSSPRYLFVLFVSLSFCLYFLTHLLSHLYIYRYIVFTYI